MEASGIEVSTLSESTHSHYRDLNVKFISFAMTASDQDAEEAPSGPVASPPAPAFVPGRRISLDAYGVKQLPRIENSETNNVDDFGLAERRRASTVETVSGPSRHESKENGYEIHDKSGSSQYASESSQVEDGMDTGKSKAHEDQQIVNDRGRPSITRARSKSAQRIAAARSRSLGDAVKPRSRPSSRSDAEQQMPNVIESESPDEKRRSRSDTLTKIQESGAATVVGGISEWSHQTLAPRKDEVIEEKEEEWQAMPALGKYDHYDDEGHLVAKGGTDSDDDDLDAGGAGKGYTRVQIDDDAKSATSMDENTSYLFKEKGTNVVDEDEDQRDPLAQMQATKDLLTEGQRIAYVGVSRLSMIDMLKGLEAIPSSKATKKDLGGSMESLKMWSQKVMVRLYSHMDIDAAGKLNGAASLQY